MTQLVGILNITPDSFSDGGIYNNPATAIAHADSMFVNGASIVDIGAESTRPSAEALSPDEEWERLEPVLKVLLSKYPGQISLDSYHPETVRKAFEIGPVIVNDVTGMTNPAMLKVVEEFKPTVIVCHLPSDDIQTAHLMTPATSVEQVKRELLAKEALLLSKGIPKEQIILDPGIGFGKTPGVNQELLRFAELVPDNTVMIGYSRKRFLGEHRMELEPNIAAGKIAIASGAQYVRVHDVAGHAPLLGA